MLFRSQLNEKLFYCDGYGSLAYITAANANSAVVAGKLSRIDIIDPGSGYTSTPTVTIAAPPSGITATATATIFGGQIVGIDITNPGSGYTTAPSVSISGGGGASHGHLEAVVSLSPPPKPIYITTHRQRIFCASADSTKYPDALYFSDILDGEVWDPAAEIRIGGDGDPIKGLYPWFDDKIIVFKERSIWAVNANPLQDPADWTISLISGNVGCVSHRSIAAVGADVFFLSRDGVRSLAQIQAGTQTDIGLPLSAQVDDILSRIDRNQYSLCDGVYWNNRYMLAFPYKVPGTSSQTTNNRVITYHILAKSWLGTWSNWTIYDFVPTAFSDLGQALMFCGKIDNLAAGLGQVYAFNDYVGYSRLNPPNQDYYRDAGQSYTSSVTTKAFNCNEPMIDKIGYNVQFSTENPYSDWSPEISWSYSLNMSGSFTSLDNKVIIPTSTYKYQKSYNLISKGRWNSIQFKQLCNDGKMAVHSVIVTGFPQNIKPQQ